MAVIDSLSGGRGRKRIDLRVVSIPPGTRQLGLTRFRGPIRVKRSGSVKGVEEDGQERQALLA